MALQIAIFLWTYLASSCSTATSDLFSEYAHHAVLDPEEKMKLFWAIDWDAETVSFALEAETTGWVGFGFSGRSGRMVGGDVIIGWVKDNKGYLTDRYAEAHSVPPIDDQQDYELMGYEESGGKTLLKFKRKFDTCDSRDRKLEKGATKVIFAYHTEDPVSSNSVPKHLFKGARTIALLNKMDTSRIDKSDWVEHIMTARNVTIPAKETTYWCTWLRGPKLNSKHHITKFEAYIQKGNEGLVHHFFVFGCHGHFTDDDFNEGVDCFSVMMPFRKCGKANLIAAWALGGEAFYFPPHAGIPIGGKGSPTTFLLEMHYNNPAVISGRRDSSGVRIFYTKTVRKYDAGVISVGISVNSWHIVPPRQKNWISTGYCMHQCTESLFRSTGLPEGGVNVFATFLHTHLAGRAAWTKHIRKGKELPEIARDDHYDFNFQDAQSLREEINIQPGDDIVHYCKYDSMDRKRAIKGGQSARDEMCMDFLVYYPRTRGFVFCESTEVEPSLKLIDKYLAVNLSSAWSNPLANLETDWTKAMVADFRKYQSEVKTVIPGCWNYKLRTVADLRNADFTVPVPKITEPLEQKKSNCSKVSSGPLNPV